MRLTPGSSCMGVFGVFPPDSGTRGGTDVPAGYSKALLARPSLFAHRKRQVAETITRGETYTEIGSSQIG